MINASELNRRVTLKAYIDGTKQPAGGYPKVLQESVTIWAKIESITGSTNPNQAQMMTDNNFRVTIRYQAKFNTNWVMVYEGQVYIINSCTVDEPQYKRYLILECGNSIALSSWS